MPPASAAPSRRRQRCCRLLLLPHLALHAFLKGSDVRHHRPFRCILVGGVLDACHLGGSMACVQRVGAAMLRLHGRGLYTASSTFHHSQRACTAAATAAAGRAAAFTEHTTTGCMGPQKTTTCPMHRHLHARQMLSNSVTNSSPARHQSHSGPDHLAWLCRWGSVRLPRMA